MDKKKQTKSYEVYYDETSKRYVFEIFDKEAMFPLLIKVEPIDPRVLDVTRNQKLHLD